ncbi:MAG: hypothetical protein K2J99_09450, partial [Lachnospiraceae bacterium]|nr:hypothetical protein [Lachnospiraceae bacterium]
MSQSDQFDNYNNGNNEANTVSDTYTTESSADIYNTPDVSSSSLNDTPMQEIVETAEDSGVIEESTLEVISEADTVIEDAVTEDSNTAPQESYTNDSTDNPYGVSVNKNTYYSDPYANNPYVGQNAQNNSPYNNNPYMNPSYGGQTAQNNNTYNGNPYMNTPYGGQTAQNNNPYNSNPYGNSQYGGQTAQNDNPYNGNPYGNSQYNGQAAQNDNPYYNNSYANNSYGGQTTQNTSQYGNNNQYGNPPFGNNQYSPYAVPQKKNNTGLIIGIVAAVIVLFLIAFGALTYKVVSLYSDGRASIRSDREEYNFDDWDKGQDQDKNQDRRDGDSRDDDQYDDDYNDYDYGYDDYDEYNYDDDEYYTLHDDIKENLSYSVEFDYYEYDTDYENVDIMVFYPVISNKDGDIPNLDKLNSTIQSEIDFLVEYFEDEYEEYFTDDGDSYFQASSTGYVTYMDEEKLSIVFSENVYSDYYNDVFLYSINIDMENGIILDNESMLNVNDDFSVEFREKSDIQNGEISYLTRMSDQEITAHFDSTDIIVFYTPQGMEIGFNYDEG